MGGGRVLGRDGVDELAVVAQLDARLLGVVGLELDRDQHVLTLIKDKAGPEGDGGVCGHWRRARGARRRLWISSTEPPWNWALPHGAVLVYPNMGRVGRDVDGGGVGKSRDGGGCGCTFEEDDVAFDVGIAELGGVQGVIDGARRGDVEDDSRLDLL